MAQTRSLQTARAITDWRWHVLIFLAAAAAIVSHRPDAILNPQFFGEDGAVWFREAYEFGWLSSLFHPYNGYFQTLPRLAGALALLAPLRFAPLVMNMIGIAFQALPVNILLSPRCSAWAPLFTRALMSIAYLALPNAMELNVTVTNAQWHLALLACLLVLASPPQRLWARILDLAVILLCGLTGPFCLVLLPLALIFWWVRRDGWRLPVIAALALCAIVQLSAILAIASVTRPKIPLGATAPLFIRLVAGQVYLAALLGPATDPTHKPLLLLVVAALLGTAFLLYGLARARLELRLFVLFAALVFAASLKSPTVSTTVPQWQVLSESYGIRYWFFPMLAFVWTLIWCAASAGTKLVQIVAVCVLSTMLIGIVQSWKYPAYTDFHFRNYAARFAAAAPGFLVNIPICPDGWTLPLTKKNPRCATLPAGSIDHPRPNAQLSGIVVVNGWAAASEPIRQISVYVDRVRAQSVQLVVARPDIDKLYPQSPDKQKGWGTLIDSSKLTAGPHEIEARALEAGGCEADFAITSVVR